MSAFGGKADPFHCPAKSLLIAKSGHLDEGRKSEFSLFRSHKILSLPDKAGFKNSNMKTIHFHVGSERCGSTLIQALFNETDMHQVLALNSIKYDPEIYLALGKVTPLTDFKEADWKPVRDDYFAAMHDQPFDKFFVTQENMFGVKADKGSTNVCEAGCDAISYLTEGFDTKIVILVRRQDTYIESLYNQLIKRQELRDFSTFLDEIPLKNFDWTDAADTYTDYFGRDNVTVLPFERQVLNSANIESFVEAVLVTIGVTQKIVLENVPTINPSLAPRVIEVQRLANKLLPEIEAHSLANWFENTIPKLPDDPHALMTKEDRVRILDFFRKSNRRLCVEYLSAYDDAYYLGEEA